MSIDIGGMREQYSNTPLDKENLGNNPFKAFEMWFSNAVEAKVKEPNAMTLATVDEHGNPDARIVLLKEVIENGFVFYTNYTSTKSKQIEHNNKACLVFNWLDLERQIRIKGSIKKYDDEIGEQYFQSRPRLSQIAAWASPQSKVIQNREELEALMEQTTALFEGVEKLPKPKTWGGFVLSPTEIEFWQGRRNRMHDRIKYFLQGDHSWKIERLAP